MVTEPEPLQGERPQPELPTRRVELRPSVGMDTVAVGKIEA